MNGTSLSSQQQLLQGLPYLHLLPSSLRNDAARLLFMPQILPPELSANMHPTNGSIDLEKTTAETSRSGPGYFCKPCNIKFSSARTLEAHQTYYCSFRQELGKENGKGEMEGSKGELMTGALIGSKKRERESGDDDRELMTEESMEIPTERVGFNEPSELNSNKMAKTGKLYSCMYCSYSADKKVSLNRHMRMHSGGCVTPVNANEDSGSASGTPTPTNSNIGMNKNLPEGVNALERFCQDCDIQFSSIKTYRVHKQYYCRTRHVLKTQQVSAATGSPPQMKMQSSGEMAISVTPVRKNSGSPVPSDGSPASTPGPMSSHQPFVVLPTNPLIIVPYCFIQAASILPGNVLPSQNALVVLPNGSVQGLPFTSIPMPIPSPSNMSQSGLSSFLSQQPTTFSTGVNNKSSNSSSGNMGDQPHSIFNDPKDILRRISTSTRSKHGSSRNNNVGYENIEDDHNNGSPEHTHASHDDNGNGSNGTLFKGDEQSDKSHDDGGEMRRGNDEGMPAIDLTLRKSHSMKEISGDEEKENREVCLGRIHNQNSQQQDPSDNAVSGNDLLGRKSSSTNVSYMGDFITARSARDACSPSETGSESCGKRTPRPSSTSISSSCSTPPALLVEPKVNGVINRLSPMTMDHDIAAVNLNSKNHPLITMMMSPSGLGGKGPVDLSAGFDMIKLKESSKGKRGKVSSHITTQLPGGAILSTSGSNQGIADLLMSNGNSPAELAEILSKISPQLLVNSRSASGSPLGLNPAILQTLSQADPELLLRVMDSAYWTNLQQQNIQQQQHQQASGKRGYSKCVECDIVFYKHENYLVHKEHYCAARGSNTASPVNSKGEPSSSRKDNVATSSSRISSCSSPAKSELDGEESQSSPNSGIQRASNSGNQQQMHIKVPRKSTDSSSSDFFPIPVFEKTKSRSPQGIPSSISISPVPSPNERREKGGEKQSQFQCMYCQVRYSSIDNLKAHQSFYCTKRRMGKDPSSSSEMSASDDKVEEPEGYGLLLAGNNKGLLQCVKCKLRIPEDQLNTHAKVCLGTNGRVPSPRGPGSMGLMASGESSSSSNRGVGWKCPCCDTYSPTVSAAQKHMECHTGVHGFKCRVCGYKGNTLRGMRTHIRTHFDKRVSDLLEAEYMTCITVNDDPHVSASLAANKSLASETTMQRTLDVNHQKELTNRHSNVEKSKLNHSPTIMATSASSSPSPNSPQELQDLKVFAIPEGLQENNNRVANCTLCNYSSSYKGHVIRHMKSVHKIPEDSAEKILSEMIWVKESEDYKETTENRKLNRSSSAKSSIHIKEEEISEAVSNNVISSGMSANVRRKNINGHEHNDEKSDGDNIEKSNGEEELDGSGLSTLQKKEKPCAVKYCKSCDIYFNHLSTFETHRKSFCSATLNNKATERAETPVQ